MKPFKHEDIGGGIDNIDFIKWSRTKGATVYSR